MLLRSMEVTAGETAELKVLVTRAKSFRWEDGVYPEAERNIVTVNCLSYVYILF